MLNLFNKIFSPQQKPSIEIPPPENKNERDLPLALHIIQDMTLFEWKYESSTKELKESAKKSV
ncbi:MAG: hypothetical protein HWD61_07860 [Parachlamydiaceae bacterium]|nr:MAG: hypothetical protein HWD61_07860 [Parachlamydiaceae bacterium]